MIKAQTERDELKARVKELESAWQDAELRADKNLKRVEELSKPYTSFFVNANEVYEAEKPSDIIMMAKAVTEAQEKWTDWAVGRCKREIS